MVAPLLTTSPVCRVETFIVTSPRATPYLGPLGPGESVNSRGYVVRRGNGTIYPTTDRSVVVRVTTKDGSVGWGETYGICAPRATCEIINDLLAPVVIGSDPENVEDTWDLLYGLMRVRGCSGGFHVDAIAALDIALWDLRARMRGVSVAALVGTVRHTQIPCYLSGLPAATLDERVAMACHWQSAGIESVKFAAVVSHEGVALEFSALRDALGPNTDIMVDLHWKYSAQEALGLAQTLQPLAPRFIEAPVKPEDSRGLAEVCKNSAVPVAAGEEWYTSYEVQNRLDSCTLAYLQPEMAHTGITQFCRIAAIAQERGLQIAPHATIGVGIFLAASLQVSSTLTNLWKHEWQHSVFDGNLALLNTDMACSNGRYQLPAGPGLGVTPNAHMLALAQQIT
ncbi:MAG: mandelate racemase/muconate lactonizing enzyme family protein [Rhodoferax sp.]|nr:mandelate racemase/muconate lactonizing enzyme family protein [Rhodoferax sp.]